MSDAVTATCAFRVFPQRINRVPDLQCQLVGLAYGHSGGIDWLTGRQGEVYGIKMAGMNGQQIM